MRGDPDYIDASCRERDRVARDKFAEERESYRAEAEQDDAIERRRGRCAGVRAGKHSGPLMNKRTGRPFACWAFPSPGSRFCHAHQWQAKRCRSCNEPLYEPGGDMCSTCASLKAERERKEALACVEKLSEICAIFNGWANGDGTMKGAAESMRRIGGLFACPF